MRRIAITGPESTGKSELSAQLAKHYDTIYVPEYARHYIGRLTRAYTPLDLWKIAQIQIGLEDRYAQRYAKNQLLFCDTELLVIKIWHEHAFGKMPAYLEKFFEERKTSYTLYLLTDIDLPWQPDPQREHPNLRSYFFDLYHKELEKTNQPFAVVSGIGDIRLQNAIKIVDSFL